VYILQKKGHQLYEIRIVTELSKKLLGKYLDLIRRYTDEKYQ